MKATDLAPLVESFQANDDHEREAQARTLTFLKTTPGIPWSRKNFNDGHICASAWILNHEETHALLFHHKKLNRWIQIGGHIEEGDADFFSAALREITEETGLTRVVFERNIFDIDVHVYPNRGEEPEHIHYDLRILARAEAGAELQVQEAEGKGLEWVEISKIADYDTDESVLHTARKASLEATE